MVRGKRKGYTLVEVVISLAVLSVFVVVFLSALVAMSRVVVRAGELNIQAARALAELENGGGETEAGRAEAELDDGTILAIDGRYRAADGDDTGLAVFEK